MTRRKPGRVFMPGDVARLRRPASFEGRRRTQPAGTLVQVIAEVAPERSRECQMLRCAVGVKSIVGYIVVPRTWLDPIGGPIEVFVQAIEQIEKGRTS